MNYEACDKLLCESIEKNIIPSAAYAIGEGRQIYRAEVRGYRTLFPAPVPADRNTRYDLASLSKLVATTTVALKLIEEGRLLLSDPLTRFFTPDELKDAPQGRAEVTVFRLMTHTSGITPHIALWTQLESPEPTAVAHTILSSPPVCRPGERVYYSCMGYILLQRILERLTGQPLDELARRYVFAPLGMERTGYRPSPDEDDVVTTEFSKLHQVYIKGHVHDENAHFLGGVAGNAGVFAPLCDMCRFAIMCATRGEYPDHPGRRFLSPAAFEAAVRDYTPGLAESRGLGFQLKPPLPGLSSAGDLMAPGSYGHTGFTGTSLWVDAATGRWAVLLTNAVHLGRDKTEWFRVRRLFHNAVMGNTEG